MRNESYTFSLLLKILNMLLLLASYIFCRMTLTLSSIINFLLAFFFQEDNFSKFSGFADAFFENRHYQTKQAIKNLQPQDCSIFITS